MRSLVKGDKYARLLGEDAGEGIRGMLDVSPYGLRGAARKWEKGYFEALKVLGFVVGRPSPRLFWGRGRDVRSVIHGDDIPDAGGDASAIWSVRAWGQKL